MSRRSTCRPSCSASAGRCRSGLGPVGLSGLYARRGEVQAAQGRGGRRTCRSPCRRSAPARSTKSRRAGTRLWFQLYIVKDRGFVSDMIARAQGGGLRRAAADRRPAVPGTRYRDYRAGLSGSMRGPASRMAQVLRRPDWAWDVAVRGRPLRLGNLEPLARQAAPRSATSWAGSHAISTPASPGRTSSGCAQQWDGPLIIKGILDPDDAREATASGADGIVVSNHGGRQLDGVAVHRSRAAARSPTPSAGGCRCSSTAASAQASTWCGCSRSAPTSSCSAAPGPMRWPARGGAGVAHVLKLIDAEMRVAMALTGMHDGSPKSTRDALDTKMLVGERGFRTSGPCLPKTVLYQAELLPDRNPLDATRVAAGAKAAAR